MRYLSIDIEATGLEEHDLIVEFAAIPFCTQAGTLEEELSFHSFLQVPSFAELKPKLASWVLKHNKDLIEKAHREGVDMDEFKQKLEEYLTSPAIKKYFSQKRSPSLANHSMPSIFPSSIATWDKIG